MKKTERCQKNHEPNFRYTVGHKTCRQCDRERTKVRYQKLEYKAFHRDYMKVVYHKRREIINRYKMRPCFDCNVQYSPWVMEFDHRSMAEKRFGIGTQGAMKSEEQLLAEIEKCDVVCANCHAERTHQNKMKIAEFKKSRKVINS